MINHFVSKFDAKSVAESKVRAYCNEEMKMTANRKAELQIDIEKLTSKIDEATAESADLKERVAENEHDLTELVAEQAELDLARKNERAAFVRAKVDLEKSIAGAQEALRVLGNYYGSKSLIKYLNPTPDMFTLHAKAEGAGNSIMGILEAVSSDFSTSLADETRAEQEAESNYEQTTQQNDITKSIMEQDIKYMAADEASLHNVNAKNASDREGLQIELHTLLEYNDKLVEMCVVKPDTFLWKKKNREVEISGLQKAVKYLDSEALMQERRLASRHLRHT